MPKLLPLLIACALVGSSCSRNYPNRSSSTTFTAATEAELRDGRDRVNGFKQELMSHGFRSFSAASSNFWEEVGLKGDYGDLKDVEITLRTGNELAMKEPHLAAAIRAQIISKAAEQEFEKLDARIKSVIRGK